MSGRGKSPTQIKSCSQASAPLALEPCVVTAQTQMNPDADTLKLEPLCSLKGDIADIIKKELQEVLGDALPSIKAEVQAVKTQLASCTGDVIDMKATLEQLTAKVTMLEDKLENLVKIRIIGVEEGAGSCSPTAVAGKGTTGGPVSSLSNPNPNQADDLQ